MREPAKYLEFTDLIISPTKSLLCRQYWFPSTLLNSFSYTTEPPFPFSRPSAVIYLRFPFLTDSWFGANHLYSIEIPCFITPLGIDLGLPWNALNTFLQRTFLYPIGSFFVWWYVRILPPLSYDGPIMVICFSRPATILRLYKFYINPVRNHLPVPHWCLNVDQLSCPRSWTSNWPDHSIRSSSPPAQP